jgi:hypothetical protein
MTFELQQCFPCLSKYKLYIYDKMQYTSKLNACKLYDYIKPHYNVNLIIEFESYRSAKPQKVVYESKTMKIRNTPMPSKSHYLKPVIDSAKLTQCFQDVIQRSFSFMADKMTKIPTWPFLVMVNFWSYRPRKSQLMTLFYWDSSDKNLKQTQKSNNYVFNIGPLLRSKNPFL